MPLILRQREVLRHALAERPILSVVLDECDHHVLDARLARRDDAFGGAFVERLLRVLRASDGAEHLHEHEAVAAIDLEVRGIVDETSAPMLRDDLKAIALRNAEALDERGMNSVSDRRQLGVGASFDDVYADQWHVSTVVNGVRPAVTGSTHYTQSIATRGHWLATEV